MYDELKRGNFALYQPCHVASSTEDLVLNLVLLLQTFEVQNSANGSDSSGISLKRRYTGVYHSFQEQPKPRTNGRFFIEAAQEQKEETLALKSQLKALEEKIENGSQN